MPQRSCPSRIVPVSDGIQATEETTSHSARSRSAASEARRAYRRSLVEMVRTELLLGRRRDADHHQGIIAKPTHEGRIR